ncbi:hypothetical protein CO058_01805 [candidate division WWE3 bacterium CG_4_9_14_0_2_um_filter_35_11]|uniref:Uncharacterized protein n=1 Tax=candidate division WWE3 bacterium CG_4_9_14_0_2_um_filter_35_11 TaxID=1975077 RepID=A0A2M8EM13_UNCKA|nr:MAG: hypothetical protein COV25_03840 [candidate division WWE3 bacterium CG10_big_fil_rev_8_21_14_0_10_35_32]PJC23760.1 MAG: hypothetical protein CO058_01805 [candidate division WWE3 bacterium CG_4_9_14_0_2_um_filter_35_11]
MDIQTDNKENKSNNNATASISPAPIAPVPMTLTPEVVTVAPASTKQDFTQEEQPVDPMDIKPENSVLNKTVSGGVDLDAEMANASKKAPVSNQANPADSSNFANNLNNEIVKPKMNYSLIAIIAGILVLSATALAYYFLVFSKQKTENIPVATVETPAVVQETPVVEAPPQESVVTDIGADTVIDQINSIGNSDSTTQIQNELDSLDFDGIDTSLQLSDF